MDVNAIMAYLKNINDNVEDVKAKQKKADENLEFIRKESIPRMNHNIKTIQADIVSINKKVDILGGK